MQWGQKESDRPHKTTKTRLLFATPFAYHCVNLHHCHNKAAIHLFLTSDDTCQMKAIRSHVHLSCDLLEPLKWWVRLLRLIKSNFVSYHAVWRSVANPGNLWLDACHVLVHPLCQRNKRRKVSYHTGYWPLSFLSACFIAMQAAPQCVDYVVLW